MKKNDSDFNNMEQRREPRYACLDVPLFYSAQSDSHIKQLGQKLYNAAAIDMSLSGLAFDIDQSMQAGDKLLMFVDAQKQDNNENIMTEVRWCRKLPTGKYRVGVYIDSTYSDTEVDKTVFMAKLSGGPNTPVEINSFCPACHQLATFNFHMFQPVKNGKGVMPLYDCSLCGTTRSLPGILNK